MVFSRSAKNFAPLFPILFLLSPSLEDIFNEITVQFFLKAVNNFLKPTSGISLELKFKCMRVSFLTKALHRIAIPLFDKKFLERLR